MDFADFYRVTSPRMLRYAYGLTGDLPLAQDVTQEAYARAWQRWRTVSAHHDIEAWLRVVVTRLVYDWWRRLGVRRALADRPEPVPGPSEQTVLLTTALKQLPKAHAQALALHYLLDLPIAEIAAETNVAEGTVKSWLSRGRAGLADLLREEADAATLAPAREVQDRGRRRRRTTVVVAGAASLVLIAVLAVFALVRARAEPQPVTPSPSPTAVGGLERIAVIPDEQPGDPPFDVAFAGGRGFVARGWWVTAIDLGSGQVVWRKKMADPVVDVYAVDPDVVVLRSPGVIIALGQDGGQLWRRTVTDNPRADLLAYHDQLVVADVQVGSITALDWKSGGERWVRMETGLAEVLAMRSVAGLATYRTPHPIETGDLVVATDGGELVQISPGDGRTVRSHHGLPLAAGTQLFAYEGKVFAATGNRLLTVDLGGRGPTVTYTAPAAGQLTMPTVCFRTAVCVMEQSGMQMNLLAVRGDRVVLRKSNVSGFSLFAGADVAVAPRPVDGPQVLARWADGTAAPHLDDVEGDVFWMDGANILVADSAAGIVYDIDPVTGDQRELARLPLKEMVALVGAAASTNGDTLIAVTTEGLGVYHVTR